MLNMEFSAFNYNVGKRKGAKMVSIVLLKAQENQRFSARIRINNLLY